MTEKDENIMNEEMAEETPDFDSPKSSDKLCLILS